MARFFSFAFPLSLSEEEVSKIRNILLEFNANRDFSVSERLKEIDVRVGPMKKSGIRNLYREGFNYPIDNYQILDRMDSITLIPKEYKALNLSPEMARFSPGSLYDMEEQEREKD